MHHQEFATQIIYGDPLGLQWEEGEGGGKTGFLLHMTIFVRGGVKSLPTPPYCPHVGL